MISPKHIIAFLTLSLAFCNTVLAQLPSGSMAPDFSVTDVSGTSHQLSSILADDKAVILNLYSVWCEDCWYYRLQNQLEYLNQGFGENGTDEIRVLSLEIDPLTAEEDILGVGQSIGNWVSGTSYSNANNDSIASLYEVSGSSALFLICPDGVLQNLEFSSADEIMLMYKEFCDVELETTDAALTSLSGIDVSFCESTPLSIVFRNLGTSEITSAEITLEVDGEALQTVSWTGSLGSLEMEEVMFDSVSATEASTAEFSVSISGDMSVENNEFELNLMPSVLASNVIRIEVYTDLYPGETSWELLNSEGEVLISDSYIGGTLDNFGAGGLDALSTLTYDYNLGTEEECFTFSLFDSEGDGMSFGESESGRFGYAIFRNTETLVLIDQDGIFTDSSSSHLRTDITSEVSESNEFAFQLYPNPTDGALVLKTSSAVNSSSVIFRNTLGEEVNPVKLENSVWDMSLLSDGIYFVNIENKGQVSIQKVVLRK